MNQSQKSIASVDFELEFGEFVLSSADEIVWWPI